MSDQKSIFSIAYIHLRNILFCVIIINTNRNKTIHTYYAICKICTIYIYYKYYTPRDEDFVC